MGSFQPRKPDLNKRNWQSHSSYTSHASFQEQGQPEKCFTAEAGGKTGPLAAAPALGASWGCRGWRERRLRRHLLDLQRGPWDTQVGTDTLGQAACGSCNEDQVGRILEEKC